MTSAMSSLRWLTGSSAGYEIGGMAARRPARAAARAAARSECDLDRPGRPDRSRAGPAGEDVTELDSISAGRIDQEGPYGITVFRPAAFRRDGWRSGTLLRQGGWPAAAASSPGARPFGAAGLAERAVSESRSPLRLHRPQ